VHDGHTELAGRYLNAPMIGVVSHVHPHWLAKTLMYLVAATAAVTLIAAANSAMLGLSRLAYSLSTNRQIPSGLGRLHPAALDAVRADRPRGRDRGGRSWCDRGPRLPVGIYAVRRDARVHDRAPVDLPPALHASPIATAPTGCRCRSRCAAGSCRCPPRFGALVSAGGLVAVLIVHPEARYVGLGWMAVGIALYVIYRRADETSLLRRVTVSPSVLRAEPPVERDYGSILVPLFGTDLDDDIVQTAALLVSSEQTDEAAIDPATIEACGCS
jgi:APA family basic amino acid/polyamine antiporter